MTPRSSEHGWTLAAIPFLDDNYAWACLDGRDAVVVDPGDAASVERWLRDHDAILHAILITHHHHDHVGGIAGLKQHWPGAKVYGPADPRIEGVDVVVRHGDRCALEAPALGFEVIQVPGHTATHIAFHGEGVLFCGDTLFSAGCGRLFEGTPAQMLASLDTLARLDGGTRVCCGHEYTASNCRFALAVESDNEPLHEHAERIAALRGRSLPTLPSTLALERSINPFLRVDEPSVRNALIRERGMAPDASRVEAFAALRAWKDVYRG